MFINNLGFQIMTVINSYSSWYILLQTRKEVKKRNKKKMGIEILYPKIIDTKNIKHGGVF